MPPSLLTCTPLLRCLTEPDLWSLMHLTRQEPNQIRPHHLNTNLHPEFQFDAVEPISFQQIFMLLFDIQPVCLPNFLTFWFWIFPSVNDRSEAHLVHLCETRTNEQLLYLAQTLCIFLFSWMSHLICIAQSQRSFTNTAVDYFPLTPWPKVFYSTCTTAIIVY